MGFIRRFLSIGLGLAAGAFAVKLLRDYNNDGHIEGEYVEVPLTEGDDAAPAEEEEPYHAPQKPDRGPNPNPVDLGTAEKPLTEDGKLDATASPVPRTSATGTTWAARAEHKAKKGPDGRWMRRCSGFRRAVLRKMGGFGSGANRCQQHDRLLWAGLRKMRRIHCDDQRRPGPA